MSICNLDHFAESYWQTRSFGLVGGAFDPLHDGHLAYFDAARAVAPWLVCAVTPDAELRAKRTPFLPEQTRLHVLNRCRDIEHVHLATAGIPAVIDVLRPTHYIVGVDWEGKLPAETVDACGVHDVTIVYVDCREQSSTAFLADYERRRNAEKLAAFERFVSQQTPAEKPWEPVTDFSYRARKAIEGKHPELVRDVFNPECLLDVGCGRSGIFLDLLASSGLGNLSGFDIQAPMPGGPSSEINRWQDSILHPAARTHFYDLVICREVFEHLTVRQIAIAVRNLVKLSSKYVYVTTRFTAQSHPLDFAAGDGLDPTHISLLNQDYLRSLFVLEGCTRRADLETKLDWMKKGRCLVYEVPA